MMGKSVRRAIAISFPLIALVLGAEAYAQATDVDCVKCVDTKDLNARSVTNGKIADKAVTTNKLATEAVTTPRIAQRAVTTAKIANKAVTSKKIALNAVGVKHVGPIMKADIGTFCAPGSVVIGKDEDGNFVCEPPEIGFEACVADWCWQAGTREQYTRCESASDDGTTCNNPVIRYGYVTEGVPTQHSGNQLDTWCQQLGFAGNTDVTYGDRACEAPKYGRVFGSTGFDEDGVWHWADWRDGFWLNQELDNNACSSNQITSVSCTLE